MYVGDVSDGTGLEDMIWEVVANTVDQHLAGRARNLSVIVDGQGWIEVEDDGPGMPLAGGDHGGSPVETTFTVLHWGATRDGHFPHVHLTTTMTGIGLPPVAALSRRLEVESRHDGRVGVLAIERGHVVSPLEIVGRSARSGLRVRFLPDPAIFGARAPKLDSLEVRLRELAWLMPLLAVRWQGHLLPGAGGPMAWVQAQGVGDAVLAVRRTIDDVVVDLALGWRDGRSAEVHSFVNLQRTFSGSHVEGLFEGLETLARQDGFSASSRVLEEILSPGLVALIHVGLLHPQFGAPTRDHLRTPLARTATARAIVDAADALHRRGAFRETLRSRLLAS